MKKILKGDANMKKTLCVLIALMLCVAVAFSGCNDDSVPGSVEDNSAAAVEEGLGDVRSDNQIEEGESVSEKYIGSQVETFINGSYYMEGTIYSSGEAMPVKLATDGTNFHFTTSMSNISIGVLILDDVTYLIQPTANVYTELSENLVAALGIEEEFDVAELTNFRVEDIDNTVSKINQSAVTINGEAGLCNEYVYDETTVRLYSIGDKLIQVDNYNSEGVLTMQIVVDTIAETIPSTQLTLKGMEKASITSFISSFMTVQ